MWKDWRAPCQSGLGIQWLDMLGVTLDAHPKGKQHCRTETGEQILRRSDVDDSSNSKTQCPCWSQWRWPHRPHRQNRQPTCLASSSQKFSQFIRPSSSLSYTSKTDCVLKIFIGHHSKQWTGKNWMQCRFFWSSWCLWQSFFRQVMHMHSQVWAQLLEIKLGWIIWFDLRNQWAIQRMNQVANLFANQPNDWDRMHCFLLTFHQKVGYATIKYQSE